MSHPSRSGAGESAPRGPTGEFHFAGAACDACGAVFPKSDLDESQWCAKCRPRMLRRLRIGRHAIAALVLLPFAIWVVRVEKLDFLPPLAWLLPLAAAYYLGLRIGGEVVKGYHRWRRDG